MQQNDLAETRSSSPTEVRVVADHREGRSGVAGALAAHDGVDVVMRQLATGDYLVDGRLAVERKTVRDLAVSLVDGRLFRQVHRLVTAPHARACLVVEGGIADAEAINVSRDAILGALVTVTLVFGLPLLRSRHPEETARLILLAGRQLARRDARPVTRYGPRPRSLEAARLLMLQTIPGVGPVRAGALLAELETVAGVAEATGQRLQQVMGIGPGTAEAIRDVLQGRAAEGS